MLLMGQAIYVQWEAECKWIFIMQFSGCQMIWCLFAVGLFMVDYHDVVGGTGFYKVEALVNWLSLLSMTSNILLCVTVCHLIGFPVFFFTDTEFYCCICVASFLVIIHNLLLYMIYLQGYLWYILVPGTVSEKL